MGNPITLDPARARLLDKPSLARLVGYPGLVHAPTQWGPGIRTEDGGISAASIVEAYAADPDETAVASALGTTPTHVADAVAYAVAVGYASEGTPPAPVFSLTPVDDATVGISANLDAWKNVDYPAQYGGPPGGLDWKLWSLQAWDHDDDGFPALIVANHYQNGGGRIYTQSSAAPMAFSDTTAALGLNWYSFGSVTGGIAVFDFDGDNAVDITLWGPSNNPWYRLVGGTITQFSASGPNASGQAWYIDHLADLDGDGDLDFDIIDTPQWPTTTVCTKYKYRWNGASFSASTESVPVPTGVPSSVTTDAAQWLDDGSQATSTRFMNVRWIAGFDLNRSGQPGMILRILREYSEVIDDTGATYYLGPDGAGGFQDMTAAWGLPRKGVPLFLKQFGAPFEDSGQVSQHLHTSIDGQGNPYLFIWCGSGAGSAPGVYRWQDTAYVRLAADPLTTRLADQDPYEVELYAADLRNWGLIDIIFHSPRLGYVDVFLNDGNGGFIKYDPVPGTPARRLRSWDARGFCLVDIDNDGGLDLICGGDAGSGAGSSETALKLAIWRNTTENRGNFLKVEARRASGGNRKAVGAVIECYRPGEGFSADALLRRWGADPGGMGTIFGLANRSTVDVKVTFPGGAVETRTAVSANQTITVTG